MLGIADAFTQAWLREPLRYLVAVSAVAILVSPRNAAMLGLSRLGYSLALNRQIPSRIGHLHPRFDTPIVLIGIGAVLAIALLLTADIEFLAGDLGVRRDARLHCSSHLSVVRLRYPRAGPRPALQGAVQRPRRRRRLPLPAVAGA